MIQEFVDRFIAAQPTLFTEKHPNSYEDIVRAVVEVINPDDDYGWGGQDLPSPNRIHAINDGDYQGTLVFVIGASGYQPSTYWVTKVSYGSCSGCDTFQSIQQGAEYDYELGEYARPTPEQAKDYQTLALHIVQNMREV